MTSTGSVIVGGQNNRIFEDAIYPTLSSNNNAFIGGGQNNTIFPDGSYPTLSSNNNAFIGGGQNNLIFGQGGSILGSDCNLTAINGNIGINVPTGRFVCGRNNTSAPWSIDTIGRVFMVGGGTNGGAGRLNYFSVTTDGNARAQIGFVGLGADYAEFFETTPAFIDVLVPGTSVVMGLGSMLEPAQLGDDPVGVVRPKTGNMLLVGNASDAYWHKKYMCDDFGTLLRDDDSQLILNPDFDETHDYVPRSERNEWKVVGLLGQIAVRVGQPVGARWRLLRSISSVLDLWLVR